MNWAVFTLCSLAACSSASSAPLTHGGSGADAGAAGDDDADSDASVTAPRDAAPVADAASPADAEATAPEAGPFACVADGAFPSTLPVPEASAAAEVELTAGVRELLIVSDSGRNGVALARRLDTGATRPLTLPLGDGASDDVEGIAWRDGKLYTLTSSGAVRRFAPDGTGGLVRDRDAYAVGAAPYACADLTAINCGKNYEGLCLRPHSNGAPCDGYAASKAEGKLYCLVLDAGGTLAASTLVAPLALDVAADRLSDCAFGASDGPAEQVLVIATNVYDLSRAYRVDETSGALTALPAPFVLNLESIAIDHEGALYTFSDSDSETSDSKRTRCSNW